MAVHRKGRYRSMIACRLLQRAVFQDVVNVIGASTRGRKPNFLCGCLWLARGRLGPDVVAVRSQSGATRLRKATLRVISILIL
jgi:hypothetical protein